jgi:hypothetical protein
LSTRLDHRRWIEFLGALEERAGRSSLEILRRLRADLEAVAWAAGEAAKVPASRGPRPDPRGAIAYACVRDWIAKHGAKPSVRNKALGAEFCARVAQAGHKIPAADSVRRWIERGCAAATPELANLERASRVRTVRKLSHKGTRT